MMQWLSSWFGRETEPEEKRELPLYNWIVHADSKAAFAAISQSRVATDATVIYVHACRLDYSPVVKDNKVFIPNLGGLLGEIQVQTPPGYTTALYITGTDTRLDASQSKPITQNDYSEQGLELRFIASDPSTPPLKTSVNMVLLVGFTPSPPTSA